MTTETLEPLTAEQPPIQPQDAPSPQPPPMRKERCQKCRYFQLDLRTTVMGACRRHAPRPVLAYDIPDGDSVATVWPVVSSDAWCGEFS